MPEFQAILFDFDGVLVDSEPVHCDCWREVLAPLGVPVTWEVYAAHCVGAVDSCRSEEHTSELQSLPPRRSSDLGRQRAGTLRLLAGSAGAVGRARDLGGLCGPLRGRGG